jgi:hypothetical protein
MSADHLREAGWPEVGPPGPQGALSPPSTAPSAWQRQSPFAAATRTDGPVRSGRVWKTAAVLAIYLAIAFLLFERIWSTDPARFIQPGDDQYNFAWFLGWVARSITHLHDPFYSNYANYPYGVNLLTNTGIVGLGALFTPVTLLFGPIASFNAIETLALAGSALSCYFFALRFVSWRPAAFFAGLLFGFSPYQISQSAGHINLTFVVLVPLIFLMLHEVVVAQRWRAWSSGLVLGLLVTGQFFISTEVLADTIVVGAAGLLAVVIIGRSSLRARLTHALAGLLWATAVAAILLAYPVDFALRGPAHISGRIQLVPQAYRSDLAGLVVPDSRLLLAPHHLATIADHFATSTVENGTYLGIVLVVATVIGAIVLWRSDVVKVAVVCGAVSFILSLGAGLAIASAPSPSGSGLPLPERIFTKLPLLDNVIPSRFSMLTDLFVSLLLAVMVACAHGRIARWAARSNEGQRGTGALRPLAVVSVPTLLAVACLVPLIPRNISPSPLPSGTPRFFTSREVDAIQPSSDVLVYPYGSSFYPNSALWQAVARFRFRQPGGTFLVPNGRNGRVAFSPSIGYTRENVVSTTMISLERGETVAESPELLQQLRRQLARWHITSVLAFPVGLPNPSGTVAFLTWLAGRQPVAVAGGGGGDLWTSLRFGSRATPGA